MEKLTEGRLEGSEAAVCEKDEKELLSKEVNKESLTSEPESWSEAVGQASAEEVLEGTSLDREGGDRLGKKKVTYYLSESLQNQLKVRATIERQAMSEVVEQALRFYLEHGDLVKRDGVGQTHRLYACPVCQSMLMFRHGNLQSVPHALAAGAILPDTDTVANLH